MPKTAHLTLDINLLKPRGIKPQLLVQLIHWALSAGRYLIIFVEMIVLVAFLARFKLDAEIADTKDSINQQLPFVKALQGDEGLIRQTQSQLSNLGQLKSGRLSYVEVLNKIAAQIPIGVIISTMELSYPASTTTIKIVGTAQNNDQLSTLLFGLRQDIFKNASLNSINLDQGLINFSITATNK